MKKKFVIVSSVMALVIASFSLGAYAATKLTLKINGKAIKTDIREINGTPYAPIKTITDSIGGYDFKYDKKTGSIDITPKATPKSTVGLSRSAPAPIGSKVNVSVDSILEKYDATVSVDQTIRGEDAWQLIQDTNMFNEEAKDGFEYLLAKATVKINKTQKTDVQVDINSYLFTLVSSAGKDYDHPMVVEPDPAINTKLYAGASHSGWIAFLVKKDDVSPLITFGRKYDGTGGAWFKVK